MTPNENHLDNGKGTGLQTKVTWPLLVIAVYVVVAGAGIPIATNFFPHSLVGRVFGGDDGGSLWWLALLIPPFLFGVLVDVFRRRRS